MARLNIIKMIGLAVLLLIALSLPTVLPNPQTSTEGHSNRTIAV